MALTATATPHVRADIVTHLRLEKPTTIITGFDRKNLAYHVVPDEDRRATRTTRSFSCFDRPTDSPLCTRRRAKAVERIALLLERARIAAAAYHAGLDDDRRHAVQDAFMTEKVRAIVATNAFGMGIDKPNVRLVVHYAMPGTLEAYYQEAGRAGRDGLPATCYLLHAFPDRFTHEFFIKGAYPERELVEEVYELLRRNADEAGSVDARAGRPRGAPQDEGERSRRRVGAPDSDAGRRVSRRSRVRRARPRTPSRDPGADQARARSRRVVDGARSLARDVASRGRGAERRSANRPRRSAAWVRRQVRRDADSSTRSSRDNF